MYKLVKMKPSHIPEYLEYGKNNCPCMLYGQLDTPFAWVCDGEMCNFEYMETHNIPYKRLLGASGTTIVSSKGDWVLGAFGSEDFCKKMLDRVVELFSRIISGGTMVNNDFMYNGYKYGAATSIKIGEDLFYLGIQISNDIDADLISNICKKKISKTPQKLPTTITENHILSIFNDYGEFYEYNSRK